MLFFAHSSTRDFDRLSSEVQRGGGHSPARRPGSDRRLRPRSCSPVAPFGGLRPFGRATARCVNQSSTGGDWVPASTGDGIGGRLVVALPPLCPHRRSNSDHVLWRNRESRSRPGNCVSRPGNAISWELSPLMNIMFIIFLFCEFLMVFAGSALLSHALIALGCHQQGHAGSKTLHQQNPPVLNWRCQLTQVDLYNDCRMVVVVVVVVF